MSIIHDFAHALCNYLDGWHADTDREAVYCGISNASGGRIVFSLTTNNKRVEIRGCFPKPHDVNIYVPDEYDTKITVSIEREPQKAAQDIQRRFLPVYLERLEAWQEDVRAERIRRSEETEYLNGIAKKLGLTATENTDRLYEYLRYGPNDKNGKPGLFVKVEIRLLSDGLDIKLGWVPFPVAEKILDVLSTGLREWPQGPLNAGQSATADRPGNAAHAAPASWKTRREV